MKKGLLFLVLLVFVFSSALSDAWATNGLYTQGPPVRSLSMGGTGAAAPQDASAAMINPAAVAKVGTRIDLGLDVAYLDVALDTSASAAGNSHGYQETNARWAPIPQGAIAGRFGESDWYYGFAVGVVSGYELDYDYSRLNAAYTSNQFDNHASTFTFEFVPSIARTVGEKWTFGFSPVMTFNRLEANFANNSYQETVGHDNGSHAFGMGFNVGTIYDLNDNWSFGLSYNSIRWNQKLNEYKDIFKRFNGAPKYIAGIAYHDDKWVIETDIKMIHWKACRMFGKPSSSRGLGWDNQVVVGVGIQRELTDRFRVRGGYNYGNSPIDEDNVFTNTMFPLINEHHMSLGAGYDLNDHVSIDMGWVHTFKNDMTDDGTGDAKSQVGRGSKIWAGVDSVQLGISYVF